MINTQHSAGHGTHGEYIEIPIGGMTCAHCSKKIQEAIAALPGIVHVSVNHAEAKAHVHYVPSQVTVSQMNAVIRRAGYLPGAVSLKIGIKGMKCASCVKTIENSLCNTPGVVSASVDPASASAKVVYQPEIASQQSSRSVAQSNRSAHSLSASSGLVLVVALHRILSRIALSPTRCLT